MPSWTFRGTILPGGESGELVAGSGPVEALPGRFALAGLVDAHCHLTVATDERGPFLGGAELASARLDELARLGVAVVRDVGGERSVTLRLGEQDGRPLVRAAGRFFAPADQYFPRMHTPVPDADLLTAVQREMDDGAAWIKLIADFPRFRSGEHVEGSTSEPTYGEDLMAAVIDAAHRRGVRVAAHCNTALAGPLVAAGVDSIEHGGGLTAADLDALGRRQGAWTPTIGASIGYDPGARHEPARGRSDRLRELLPYAVSAGVRVLAGSDVVGSVTGEVAALVEHGLPAADALAAATTEARTYLDVPGQDLVTYHHDPRLDPTTLHTPAAVVLRNHRTL
jgi:imidazolonepropionase-like amidohydrolase